jgi:hypothetical protein
VNFSACPSVTSCEPLHVSNCRNSGRWALEDEAAVLQRKLSPKDRQQAIPSAKFATEIENLYEPAGRLKAKLENCYVKITRYTVRIAAEEKKNRKTRKKVGDAKGLTGWHLKGDSI